MEMVLPPPAHLRGTLSQLDLQPDAFPACPGGLCD